jgi:hypothetical protein
LGVVHERSGFLTPRATFAGERVEHKSENATA